MKRYLILSLLLLFIHAKAEAKHIIELNTGNGLSSSLINCMFQDSYGDMWIGTENGLNRYNGVSIKVYKNDAGKPCSLCDNTVRTVMEDSRGNLLIGTQNGVQIYNRESDCFSMPLKTEDGLEYKGNVNAIVERMNGEIWISGNRLFRLLPFEKNDPVLSPVVSQLPNEMTGDLLEDEFGDLWLTKFNYGVYRLTVDGSLFHYQTELLEGPYNRLSAGSGKEVFVADNHGHLVKFDRTRGVFVKDASEDIQDFRINTLLYAGDGVTYLGTDGNGAFVKDSGSEIFRQMAVGGINGNLERAKVHSMLMDDDGNLWLGIYQRGVIMVPPEDNMFWYLGRHASEYDLIGSCSTTSFLVDSKGKVWVGTDNDGVYELDQPFKLRRHYALEDGLPGTCFGLMEDSQGNIWFGTYSRGVWRIDTRTGKVQSGSEFTGAQIDDRSVYAIAEDRRGRVWLGCMGHSMCYYNQNTQSITFPDFSSTDLSKWVLDLLIQDNLMYVASYDGLFSIDISNDEPLVKQHLIPGEVVYSLELDEDILYCCTSEGVVSVSLSSGNIVAYTTADGLADNMIHDARVAAHGKIWFSTGAGLSLFDASTHSFSNFYSDDGFLVSEFSWKSSAYYEDLLLFGGSDGVALFNPDFVQPHKKPLPTRIVEIQVANRYVPLVSDNTYTLRSYENSCSISFTTEDYNAPAGVVFSYSIDGKRWTLLPQGQRNITLSKLSPGRYRLMVKAIDRGEESAPVNVNIRVLPPWWGSLTAIILYILLAISAIALLILLVRRNIDIRRERERHMQVEEANDDKVKFFINLSHEIRSPLTLISAPLQSLMESDQNPIRQRSYLIMDKSVKQVLQVVNQMLDIRKMEKGMMALSFSPVNIVDYVSSIVTLFKEQAERKGLELAFSYYGLKEIEVWIDPNNFDKVIINLLSNAVKNTPEGGLLMLRLRQKQKM